MKKRETYTKKHVHRWTLIEKKPAVQAGYDYWQQEHVEAKPMRLKRECADCGTRHTADVDDENKLVTGYEAVSDFEWKEEV